MIISSSNCLLDTTLFERSEFANFRNNWIHLLLLFYCTLSCELLPSTHVYKYLLLWLQILFSMKKWNNCQKDMVYENINYKHLLTFKLNPKKSEAHLSHININGNEPNISRNAEINNIWWMLIYRDIQFLSICLCLVSNAYTHFLGIAWNDYARGFMFLTPCMYNPFPIRHFFSL